MQFKDIIGQQTVKEQLVQMVQQNRLSHALLFLGKEGSGALSLAIAFAQYIVCNSAKESKKNESSLFEEVKASPSSRSGEGEALTSSKSDDSFFLLSFAELQTMYWANAMASDNAPLPSLPKNNKAWLKRFC